jgi:hypothetical protein
MRNFVTIDSSKFPIVVAKYPAFIPTKEEFLQAQTDCENFYTNHVNFVFLVDLSNVPYLPNEYRISQAKWVARLKELHIKQKIRFVFYTPTLVVQVMMKALFILGKPGVPYTVTTNLEKAHKWAAQQLAENS